MKRVLFLCIGNSCRSQMAEGFARKYGSDVLEPLSAGFSPASIVQPLTKKVMEAKNINIDDQSPKDLGSIDVPSLDIIVNISGRKLPTRMPIEVRDWKIEDPIGKNEETYEKVRDELEHLVMRLILDLRRAEKKAAGTQPSRDPSTRVSRPAK